MSTFGMRRDCGDSSLLSGTHSLIKRLKASEMTQQVKAACHQTQWSESDAQGSYGIGKEPTSGLHKCTGTYTQWRAYTSTHAQIHSNEKCIHAMFYCGPLDGPSSEAPFYPTCWPFVSLKPLNRDRVREGQGPGNSLGDLWGWANGPRLSLLFLYCFETQN